VAIAGAFLIGLGFNPFQAATLCLLANTAPVAWGGVGNPLRILAGVTGLDEMALSAMTGRISASALGDSAALAGAEYGQLERDA
jgi:lactate permease